jgi:hypothetical protein
MRTDREILYLDIAVGIGEKLTSRCYHPLRSLFRQAIRRNSGFKRRNLKTAIALFF